MKTLEEAREFFSQDKYAMETTGAEILEVGENYARCRLKTDGRHCKVTGEIMGGAIFTLADFTYAVASNLGDSPTVTVTSTISYVNAAKGNVLTAESRLIKEGRSMCFYEVTVKDNTDRIVAVVNVTGKHV